MKKKVIMKLFSSLLSFLIAIFMILIIFASVSVGNKSVFGYRLFIVVSGSMTGTIDQGEFILTKKPAPNSLKPNDIITFVSNDTAIYGKPNTHRIMRIEKDLIYTKGDANPVEDTKPITLDNVLGKVIFHNKYIGFLIQKLSSPAVMFLFIIVPLGFMVISEIRNVRQKMKHPEE